MSLHEITERWNLFGVTATALLTCITGFVVLPPLDHGQDSFTHFGIFIVTVMVGLWFIPTQLWVSRRARHGWLIGGVLMLALGIAAYFFYDSKLNDWTFEYPANSGQREIAGSVLSENAQTVATRLKQAGQVASPSNVAWEMGGNFAAIYPDTAERNHRLHLLLGLYLLQLLLFASVIVTVVQATFCGNQLVQREDDI